MLSCLIAGCGYSDRCPLGKVAGLVTYNGEPVDKATIVFHNPHGRSAVGQIADGVIENVTTYDRLNVGALTVTIHPIIDGDIFPQSLKPSEKPKRPARPPFPQRYSDPKQSGLTAEIHDGVNVLEFDLTN